MSREINIPEGVEVDIDRHDVTVTGPEGSVERRLYYPGITITKEHGYVRVEAEKQRRSLQAMEGTYASHISNMVKGVTEGFEYKLKVLYSHFPIQVKVQGNNVVIDNFMGENRPRKSKILDGASVQVDNENVTVTGPDKEAVGQTAANLEQTTAIRGKDPRVFQDGIYIVEKA